MDTKNELIFENRGTFRKWLEKAPKNGVWLVFGKKGGPKTVTHREALEEALCFGWIDGLIKKIDEKSYKVYFAPRVPESSWSEKNKKLYLELESRGIVKESGKRARVNAIKHGKWNSNQVKNEISDEAYNNFLLKISENQEALKNFKDMTKSVQKTYILFYLDAKKEETKNKRIIDIINKLEQNKPPM